MVESMAKETLMMRMTPTIPATPLSATVKALQTGIQMRRIHTVMRVATAKMEEKMLLYMRETMEDCMRERRRASMRMRR